MSFKVEQLESRQLLCGVHLQDANEPPASPLLAPSTPLLTASAKVTGKYALSAVPALDSRPGATAQLVLDFNGDAAYDWNFGGGSYDVPETPAYSIDSDRDTFTDAELNSIREIWSRVAEKYSPFNINVTTVDTGSLADKKVQKVVIGGNGSWLAQDAGGVGTYGGFAGAASNKVYVFSDKSGGSAAVVAEAASHEAGHGFGLEHQSLYNQYGDKDNEYNNGSSSASPIMGFNPSSARKLWWVGRNAWGVTQNDADVIAGSRNGFGYRTDDFGLTAALLADGANLTAGGVIERNGDSDGFVFSTKGTESVGVRVSIAAKGPTIDARFEIRTNVDSGYKLLAKSGTTNLNETLANVKLPEGTYRLVVASSNTTSTSKGYGLSLGSYSVKVLAATTSSLTYEATEGASVSLTAAAGGSTLTYKWDLDADGIYGETGTGATFGNESGRTVTFNAQGLAAGTTRGVKLQVTDGTLTSVAIASVTVKATEPTAPQLPSPWHAQDIGATGATGSTTSGASAGSFAVKGAGANVYGTTDAFHFVSQSASGQDVQIVARIDAFSASQGWAKAGVMMRAGTDAGAKNAYMYVTATNGVQFAVRDTTGGTTWSSTHVPSATIPQWVKLVRHGNTLSGYASANGSTWQLIGSRSVDLGSTTLSGLAVTSRLAGTLATATFSNAVVATPPLTASTTLTATQDTYVRDGANAGVSFGAETTLMVKRSTPGYSRETYVNFDLSTIGSTVGRAVLRLYGNTDGANVRIGVSGTTGTSPWTDSALTYTNRPTPGVMLATTTVTATAGWYEWDVTAYLQSQKSTGLTIATLVVRGVDTTATVASFGSSEGSNGPQLIVS